MKRINKYFVMIITLVAVSCNDAIDIQQPGRLSADVAFSSVADLETGVLGNLVLFDQTPAIQFNALFTDELSIGLDNGGQGIGDGGYNFVLNAASAAPTAMWTRYYLAINFSTRIIEAAAEIVPEAGEQEAYDNAVGSAHALRAWAHFELQTYFSPDLADDNALGVIPMDFIPEITIQPVREANSVVWALIESDIASARRLLTTESSATFMSQDFLKALQARMYAYRGDYSQADDFAAELLEDYSLSDPEEYVDMFLDEDDGEVIFKLERVFGGPFDGQGATGSAFAGGWAGANFAFVDATIDGSPYFEMGRALFNELDPADVRYEVSVAESSIISDDYQNDTDFAANDVLVVAKYPGSEGQPLLNDLKIFRASEMLLIRAEAAAANNQLSQVASYISDLRTTRFGSNQIVATPVSQEAAFALVLNERRVELAFEGFRYVDIKRLGERAGLGVSRDPLDCAFNGACSLPADDYRFAFPIPIVETNANPDIQQNDGY